MHPRLERRHRQLSDRAQASPVWRVVRLVDLAGLLDRVGSQHDLVLIELAGLRVDLVDHKRLAALRVLADEGVNAILIVAHRALDVAIVVLHRGFPGRAVRIDAASGGSARVLDGDVQALNADVTLLVVAGFLLRLRRLGQIVRGRRGGLVGLHINLAIQHVASAVGDLLGRC